MAPSKWIQIITMVYQVLKQILEIIGKPITVPAKAVMARFQG